MHAMGHSIATDRVSWQGMGARVPKGTIHAVLEGVNATACGRSLDGLHKFPEIAFESSNTIDGVLCPDCLRWTSGTDR
jgi:hypothetical protein